MYLKAWCTCRAVVLQIKPILLSLSSLSPSWLPKLRIVEVKTCYMQHCSRLAGLVKFSLYFIRVGASFCYQSVFSEMHAKCNSHS